MKAFNYVDSEGNHVITKEDFTKDDTVEVLEHWLGPNEDWEEEFDNIDLTNKKGEGNVLFRVSDQSYLPANQIYASMSDKILSLTHLNHVSIAGILWLGSS